MKAILYMIIGVVIAIVIAYVVILIGIYKHATHRNKNQEVK